MFVSSGSCILSSATKQDNRRSLYQDYAYDYESRVRHDEPESEYGAPNIPAEPYESAEYHDSDPVSHDPYNGHDTANHDPDHGHDTANQDPYHGHDTANHDPDLNSHAQLLTVDPEPHQYEYFVNHGGTRQHVNNEANLHGGGYIADLKQEEFKPSLILHQRNTILHPHDHTEYVPKFAHHTADYKYF